LTDFFSHVSFTLTEARSVARAKLLNTPKDIDIQSLKRTVFCHYARGLLLTVLFCLTSFTVALSQKPTTPTTDAKQAKPVAKPAYKLVVKTQPILNLSLKADKARVADVAQELSTRLKIPVVLGKDRQNEKITVEFSELTLEPALQLLAPQVYVDYEIDTGTLNPKPLGIYLFDANQGEPPLTTAVNGTTQSMLIEGNTEDGVEPETDEAKQKLEQQPLRITFANNLLTVKAKKQPLPVVLLKIGEEIGIPVEIQDQAITIIDTEISKLPVEDVVRQLSPHIRLFVRADLTHAEKRALRLVLAGQAQANSAEPMR
jgi:hypothetical protein